MQKDSITLHAGKFDVESDQWESVDSSVRDFDRNELVLATINIWFGAHFAEQRYDAIIRLLKTHQPDFIALQEVILESLWAFLAHPWVQNNYYISDTNGMTLGDYGVVLLSRFPPKTIRLVHLPSFMDRNLLLMETTLNGATLQVGTVHLESMKRSAKMRGLQLEYIFDYLEGAANVVLMGDFNFCASWQEENDRIDLAYHDIWSHLRGDEPGYTEDTTINKMRYQLTGKHKHVRFDRILLKGSSWKPSWIELIGTEPISSDYPNVFPSDHFGLVCHITKTA